MKGEPLDGKTETPDKRMEVKDGVILVNTKDANGKGGIKDLYTARSYDKDFHLKLEFRAARGQIAAFTSAARSFRCAITRRSARTRK